MITIVIDDDDNDSNDNNNNTVFARLSAPCGCKLGIFSVTGVLSNICITAPPNECRSWCYVPQQEIADRWQLRSPSIYLLVLLKQ